MGHHRTGPPPRRRLALGAGVAVVVLGLVVAVLALRPAANEADEAVQDAGAAAVLPRLAPSVPLPLAVVPPVPLPDAAPATTTTTTTRTTTTTTTSRRTTTRAAVPAAASGPAGRVLALVNAARADAGCGPVARNGALDRAAADYAALMARSGTFSHTGPDGSEFSDRVRAAGYDSPGGENIARGQSSADEVMDDWMNSPGHRRNILDCSFRTLGVGESDDHWVQEFGR
ncbi:CAP domain-containing protein [Actinomycetospora termitidis]|uniref:CAP domain-containing protein n=1 Tax=Actinomycetospora termitidis TaxID=3053470 RepID=A0ABT7M898_9PSEU|nr:CAP domain-containing protein [Actinomycetospora sp. Odt1-22]MDL5156813.1 CAP domain-containing protein [Actinomycetospora sp. Odt1-22]